jgi:hypothetical protein
VRLLCWGGIQIFVGVFIFSKSEYQCGSVEKREYRTIEDRTILRMYTELLNHEFLSFVFCIFSNIYCFSLHISMQNKIVAYITNFKGHDLAKIVMWNFLFIGSYGINTNVIHLLVLFKHWCHVHCLDMNVICMFVLFRHKCYVFIHIVYTWKLCTWLSYLNNASHSCVDDTNLWNNKFRMNLEWTYKAYKFVMNYDKFITMHILRLWDMCSLKYHGWCMHFYYKFCITGNKHAQEHKLQLNQC